jgi:hypothetical protein
LELGKLRLVWGCAFVIVAQDSYRAYHYYYQDYYCDGAQYGQETTVII